jgi:hypothetical protein
MNRDELIEVVYRGAPTLHEYDYNQGDYARAIIKHALSAIEAAGFAVVPVVASDVMELDGAYAGLQVGCIGRSGSNLRRHDPSSAE